MTDTTPTPPPLPPAPPETEASPPERVRVTSESPPSRSGVAPVIYLAGLLVLAVALFFLWRYPSGSRRSTDEANRLQGQVQAMQAQVDALTDRLKQVDGLTDRLKQVEARPVPDLGPLDARIAGLEKRPAVDLGPTQAQVAGLAAQVTGLAARPGPDMRPIESRLDKLEARPVPAPVDLGPLSGRVDTVVQAESRQAEGLQALGQKLDSSVAQLSGRVAAVEKAEKDMGGLASRAERTARVQAAGAALDAGRPLGAIPDAPPALARYATAAPATLASLRLGYGAAAEAAHAASQPAITDNQGFFGRAWTTAQQAVTVRQGDRVLVGDPVSGVLAHAKDLLDAGDVAGAVKVLGGLAGPARSAMADWIGQAQGMLDARAALAELAGDRG